MSHLMNMAGMRVEGCGILCQTHHRGATGDNCFTHRKP